MSNLIRKILNRTRYFAQWKFLIKNNFNLANVMRKSVDLELEELCLERSELEARAKMVYKKQRCVECMLTDLTRNIKQMEFDIELMKIQKPADISPTEGNSEEEPTQKEQRQQKI